MKSIPIYKLPIGLNHTRLRSLFVFFCLSMLSLNNPVFAGGDWNDRRIKWMSLDDGLVAAKKEHKPVCLIIYTDWCPHCTAYSKVFSHPKLIETAKKFIMVRLNMDNHRTLTKKYSVDGEYVPRTYFLNSDGKAVPQIHAPRDDYKYFYDENSPDSILKGMESALKMLK